MSGVKISDNTSSSAINESSVHKQQSDDKLQRINAETRRINRDANDLARIVQNNANPNPSVIAGSILIVVGVMYLVYVYWFKPNASGEWYDDTNTQWIIKHDVWSDNISLVINGIPNNYGVMVDNMFKYDNVIGVWNYHDVILLVDGGNLTRVRN